jgi:hypothetical protein
MTDQPASLGLVASKLNGTEFGTILAGFAGSMVTLRFLGSMPWYERILVMIGSVCITYYVTPLAVWGLSVDPHQTGVRDGIACFVGMFGISAIQAAMTTLSAYNANPLDWLRMLLRRDK